MTEPSDLRFGLHPVGRFQNSFPYSITILGRSFWIGMEGVKMVGCTNNGELNGDGEIIIAHVKDRGFTYAQYFDLKITTRSSL